MTVNDGLFFDKLFENMLESVSEWMVINNKYFVVNRLTNTIQQSYSNGQRNKNGIFRFKHNNQITRNEYGQHFIPMLINPHSVADESVYNSLFVAPSFVPRTSLQMNKTVPNSNRIRASKLSDIMINEVAGRIAAAAQKKHECGLTVGSILLDYNSEQRAEIVNTYNSRPTIYDNLFSRDMHNLKGVEKVSKNFLFLLQYSLSQLDGYWIIEACNNGKIGVLYEILASRTKPQLIACINGSVKECITDKYGKDVKFMYMANRIMDGSREQSLEFSDRECFYDAQVLWLFSLLCL